MLKSNQQQRLQRVREAAFNLAQHANEVLLPSYNALKDPYLSGYFDNPLVKRNLKETGVIKRKRKLSVKLGRDSPQAKSYHALTERETGHRRAKSLIKSTNYLKNQVKLPALEELLQEERAALTSSATTRAKHIYRSSNHQ